MAQSFFAGIDVSKARLDVAFSQGDEITESFSIPHTEDQISGLIEKFKKTLPQQIVIEASGGLERFLAAYLDEAGLPIAVINPRQVRDFARATGQLAKTDKIDARTLARFAAVMKPPQRPIKDAQRQQLADKVARRRQLVHMLAQEKNRRSRAPGPVRANIEHHIKYLQVIFPRKAGQEVKHLVMKQYVMEVRDVQDQKVIHGGVQAGSCGIDGEGRQQVSSRSGLGCRCDFTQKMAAQDQCQSR